MRECCYNQHLYGGKVYSVSEQEDEEKYIDGEVFSHKKDTGRSYYILNVSDKQKLIDGFRLMKEMILQNHNYAMNNAYETLLKSGINVYSVKTDAFVIDRFNLKKAQGLLNFSNAIGDRK